MCYINLHFTYFPYLPDVRASSDYDGSHGNGSGGGGGDDVEHAAM